MAAIDTQHGGDHYKRMGIEPWAVVDTWPLAERIGFYRGNLLKYTMRLHDKDTPADNVGKAKHYAAKLAEVLTEPWPICPGSKTPCHSTPCPAQETCAERYGVQSGLTPDADGWLPWSGGERPSINRFVDVKFRDGTVYKDQPVDNFNWSPSGSRFDIVAYRLA